MELNIDLEEIKSLNASKRATGNFVQNIDPVSNEYMDTFYRSKMQSEHNSKRPSGSSIAKSDLKINSRKTRSMANTSNSGITSISENEESSDVHTEQQIDNVFKVSCWVSHSLGQSCRQQSITKITPEPNIRVIQYRHFIASRVTRTQRM